MSIDATVQEPKHFSIKGQRVFSLCGRDNRIRKTAGKEKISGVGQENHGIEQMGQIGKGTFKKNGWSHSKFGWVRS